MMTERITREFVDRPIAELHDRQALLDRMLIAEGAGHIVHDLPVRADGRAVSLASRPWRLDPVPYVIGADDFAWLERAITERMHSAEAILRDLYGPRRLVAERVVDPAVLWATPRYRMSAMGSRVARWLTTYGVDVVRDAGGRWHALQELTDAPPGLGYALMSRAVTDRVDGLGGVGDQLAGVRSVEGPRSLRPALTTLRQGLGQTTSVPGPRIATFTGGIDHASYVEHSYLATQLGFNLVEGADLVVRQRRLWLRTLAGLAPIDVLHRRLEDDELDPLEVGTEGTAGIPSVLLPVQAANLSLANAYGSGLLEALELSGRWDAAGAALTGRSPLLPLAAFPGADARRVDRWIDTPAERTACLAGDRLVEAPVVVRMHAVATDEGVVVVPGGAGRVLAEDDDPRHPTPCLGKDVWVFGHSEPIVIAPAAVPQVDLIASVPTRAADSLYWLGRATERPEALARMLRVVVPAVHESAETDRVLAGLLDAVRPGAGVESSDAPSAGGAAGALAAAIGDTGPELARDIGALLAESSSVREFLSTTTGHVLGRMVDVRSTLQAGAPATGTIDELLLQLSAFAGLWSESVLHGPAWFYGEFGRRYERAVATLSTVASALQAGDDPGLDAAARTRALECVLAANDSLVAYRRRHRSDVTVPDVVALLVADGRNPRSVAASLLAMRDAAVEIGWDDGRHGLAAVEADLLLAVDGSLGQQITPVQVRATVGRIHELAGSLTATRLVVPPDPATMGRFT